MKCSYMYQTSSITIYCSNFNNDLYDWTTRFSKISIKIMNTKISIKIMNTKIKNENQKWSILFIKNLIKKFIQKSIDISNNFVFIFNRSKITNTFIHFFLIKFNEKLRLIMLQYLNLILKLILKLTCVQFWNFVNDYFNRS